MEVMWFQERFSDGDINLEGLGQLYRLDLSHHPRVDYVQGTDFWMTGSQDNNVVFVTISYISAKAVNKVKTRRVS